MVHHIYEGTGGVSATVPVLSAVRDTVTGLDIITVPAVAGAPSRTILINPVPVGPAAPAHTGSNTPTPVTPVHRGEAGGQHRHHHLPVRGHPVAAGLHLLAARCDRDGSGTDLCDAE